MNKIKEFLTILFNLDFIDYSVHMSMNKDRVKDMPQLVFTAEKLIALMEKKGNWTVRDFFPNSLMQSNHVFDNSNVHASMIEINKVRYVLKNAWEYSKWSIYKKNLIKSLPVTPYMKELNDMLELQKSLRNWS